MTLKRLAFIMTVLMCWICVTAVKKNIEKRILDTILLNNTYDSRISPEGTDANTTGPALVTTNMYIRLIDNLDPIKMEFSTQLTFRMMWNDNRLTYNDQGSVRYLTLTDPSLIWKPDVFFSNEKSGHFHNIIMPNVLLRIYPNGDILYSTRLSLTLSCPMDLSRFPFDSQRCFIKFATYGYTTEDLVLAWKKGDPVQVTKSLHLPHMKLTKFRTDDCTSKTNSGEYSCLVVHLSFHREKSHYIWTIFLPFTYLTALALSTFWFKPTSATLRVGLCLVIILIMNVKMNRVSANLPDVSHTRTIDEWNVMCVGLVVVAIAECGLVQYLLQREERQPLETNDNVETMQMEPLVEKSTVADESRRMNTRMNKFRSLPWSTKVDLISRFVFPVVFVLFNIVFWFKYGRGRSEYNV